MDERDGTDESVYLFDRASGRLLRRVGGLPNVVCHLAFSPDGSRLAADPRQRRRAPDRPAAGQVVAADEGYGGQSYGAAFDAAGRLATTSLDGKVRLYDPGLRLLRAAERRAASGPEGSLSRPTASGSRSATTLTAVDVLDAGTLERLFAADTKGVDNGQLSSGRLVGGRRQPLRRRALVVATSSACVTGQRRAGRAGRPAAEPETRSWPCAGCRAGGSPSPPPTRGSGCSALTASWLGAWGRPPPTSAVREAPSRSRRTGRGSASGTSRGGKSPALFSLRSAGWTGGGSAAGLAAARTAAPGLAVEGWKAAPSRA